MREYIQIHYNLKSNFTYASHTYHLLGNYSGFIMTVLFFLIINYAILLFRLRISKQIYRYPHETPKTWYAILIWSAVALTLYGVHLLFSAFGLSHLLYTLQSSIPTDVAIVRSGILSLLSLLSRLCINKKLPSVQFFLFCVAWCWVITMLHYITSHILALTFLYFFLVSSLEEFWKITGSWSIEWSSSLFQRSTILYAILVGLWFAFMENILYLLSLREEFGIYSLLWFTISRWAVSFIVHVVFTWSIAYIFSRFSNSQSRFIRAWWYVLWFFVWLMLHFWRNLLVNYWITRWIILSVLCSYIIISYLFFSSDRLYIQDWVKS